MRLSAKLAEGVKVLFFEIKQSVNYEELAFCLLDFLTVYETSSTVPLSNQQHNQ